MQLAYDSDLSNDVRELRKTCVSKGVRPDVSEISAILRSRTSNYSRIIVVVDALDECSNSAKDFLQDLQKIVPGLSLFVTSRDRPNKTDELPNIVHTALEASQEEIRAYVESRVDGDRDLKALVAGDENLRKQIVDQVSLKTEGM